MFNRQQFTASFPKSLSRLERVEKMSKDVLMPLSRDLLFMLHSDDKNQGDIGYINRTIAVLSPANRKVFVLFLKEYTGFIANDEGTMFIKKSKAHYEQVRAITLAWLEDPMNNFYSWVGRVNLKAEKAPFTLDMVTENVKKMLSKADDAGLSHADVLAAMFKGGLTMDNLISALDTMGEIGTVVSIIDDKYVEQ